MKICAGEKGNPKRAYAKFSPKKYITLHYNDNKCKTALKEHSNKMDKQLLSWMSVCACVCVCLVCAQN